jgi:hypothetical protein
LEFRKMSSQREQVSTATVELPKYFFIPSTRQSKFSSMMALENTHGLFSGWQSGLWADTRCDYCAGNQVESLTRVFFSQIFEIENASEEAKLAIFSGIMAGVDEAHARARPTKRRRLNGESTTEEDSPCALWWNLHPAESIFSSSFEQLIDGILQHSNIVAKQKSKTQGHRVCLLVLESAHLLGEDLSAMGRWALIKDRIAKGGSATKVVCLYDPARQSHCRSDPVQMFLRAEPESAAD